MSLSLPRVCIRLIGVCALAALAACKSKPRVVDDSPPVPPPSYASIAETQNARVKQLEQFYARGVIEIRWKDSKGNHFEQGGAELWVNLPRRTALRVEKVGEVLLWLGSDAERFWLFDQISEPTTLHVARHDEPALDDGSRSALAVRPLELLDMLGLGTLPAEALDDEVRYDKSFDAWVVTIEQTTGVDKSNSKERRAQIPYKRLLFDRTSLLPVRVEIIDAAGNPQFVSSLRRYASARQSGMSPLMFPKLPTLIDITSPGAVSGTQGEVKLAIDEATGIVDDQPMDRVFDVNRLTQALKPQKIEGNLSP